ncbi:MAG: DUF2806 domain-containing protein [Thermodesulfobacteriota bacterium]
MVDVKDVVGLSEPLKKLIEVVANGIGAVTRPTLIRKEADARAYEIRTIAQAVAESGKQLDSLRYQDGCVGIEARADAELLSLPEAKPEERLANRLAYQEAKRQSNIENITIYAAEELSKEDAASSEALDEDWISRFFRIGEDIASEEMQRLWGKVLAGEVVRPGSYSMRTLDVLKNINKAEAETFVKVARLAFSQALKAFLPTIDNGKYLEAKYGLTFADVLLLREIGLLTTDLALNIARAPFDRNDVITWDNMCMVVFRPEGTPAQQLLAVTFTEIGNQLTKLVDGSDVDYDYVKRFASLLMREEGVIVKYGPILEWLPTGIRTGDLVELSTDNQEGEHA